MATFIEVESSNEMWCSEVLTHFGQHLTLFLPRVVLTQILVS